MAKTIKASEYGENYMKAETDYKNPKCKDCNECCNVHSSISKKEKWKILKFLHDPKNVDVLDGIRRRGEENIKIGTLSLICPFSNNEKRCDIYNIRPEICRAYHCSPKLKKNGIEKMRKKNKHTIGDIFGFGWEEFKEFLSKNQQMTR